MIGGGMGNGLPLMAVETAWLWWAVQQVGSLRENVFTNLRQVDKRCGRRGPVLGRADED
jgi:hypothetical protein